MLALSLMVMGINHWWVTHRPGGDSVRVVTNAEHQAVLAGLIRLLGWRVAVVDLGQILWAAAESPQNAKEQLHAARSLVAELDRRAEIDAQWTVLGQQAREVAADNEIRQQVIGDQSAADSRREGQA